MRRSKTKSHAYTLAEVLAALVLTSIVVVVSLEGAKVASRAGLLGQRKAQAMRVAERVLNEMVVTGQLNQGTNSGSIADGDTQFNWSMQSQTWSEDAMQLVTVTVNFTVQDDQYDVSLSTLYDSTNNSSGSTTSSSS